VLHRFFGVPVGPVLRVGTGPRWSPDWTPGSLAYVEQHLAPALRPGEVLLMDNLSSHKVAGVREAVDAAGATLRCRSSYSPDLNPIEQVFAKLKAVLRAAGRAHVRRWNSARWNKPPSASMPVLPYKHLCPVGDPPIATATYGSTRTFAKAAPASLHSSITASTRRAAVSGDWFQRSTPSGSGSSAASSAAAMRKAISLSSAIEMPASQHASEPSSPRRREPPAPPGGQPAA
jgi:DDE superfamily endonuclease